MNLPELAQRIKDNSFSLFLGAGSSVPAGGPSSSDLLKSLSFNFSVTKENLGFFELIDEIVGEDESRRHEVDAFIRYSLGHIGPTDEHRYLFSLPWKAVLTTNYDDLPDIIGKSLDGNRSIRTMVKPTEEINLEKHDVLYCFKLFGDLKISHDSQGSIVLTNSDRRIAYFQSDIYKWFSELASAGFILYLGYSFEDNLVFDILREMSRASHKRHWPGFAITPHKPREVILSKMKAHGIEWIGGTLSDLVKECRKVHGNVPNSVLSHSAPFLVHGKPIVMTTDVESNIAGKYQFLNQSFFNYQSSPLDFIAGKDRKFEPFKRGWDYPRRLKHVSFKKTDQTMISPFSFVHSRFGLDISDNGIIGLVGSAASGKSIVAKRIASEWYNAGHPVIFFEAPIKIDKRALQDLMEEMRKKYHALFDADSSEIKAMRYLVIAENCSSYIGEIINVHKYLSSLGKTVDFMIVERTSALTADRAKKLGFSDLLELDDTISESELENFMDHFSRHGLLNDKQALISNIKDTEVNNSFFGLLYTSVRNIQTSLRESIQTEYNQMNNIAKSIYAVASVLRAYEQKAYLPLIARVTGIDDYELLATIVKDLGGVLTLDKYNNTVMVNHRIIAEIVANAAYPANSDLKHILARIIESINAKEFNQLELLHDLVARRISEEHRFRPFTFSDREELFKTAISLVPSGILLHHLARLYLRENRLNDCEKYLQRSKTTHEPHKRESLSYLKDTEGRLELEISRVEASAGRKESAFDHLLKAENLFKEAIEDESVDSHAFHGLADTYFRMSILTESYGDKANLLALGASCCATYKTSTGDIDNPFINQLQHTIFSEMEKIQFDEKLAKELAAQNRNAEGFAYLAEKEINHNELDEALRLINEGLTFDRGSGWLNALRIFCFRKLWPNDVKALGNALTEWANFSRGPFNIGLTFELAKFKYMNGHEEEALSLFSQLSHRTYGHPERLLVNAQSGLWQLKEGTPTLFDGTIIKIPRRDSMGEIRCTSDSTIRNPILVARRSVKFDDVLKFTNVHFLIGFNYLGPQAIEVRKA